MPELLSSEVVTSAAVHCKKPNINLLYHIPHTWKFTCTDTTLLEYNWASVSEPHTCDFNATFSLYICICDRHCTSKIAINMSIFHLGSYTRRACNCPDAERSAPPIFEATAHRGRAVNLRVACALAV